MASRISRTRAVVVAAGLSTLLALLTVGAALADGGTSPFPR